MSIRVGIARFLTRPSLLLLALVAFAAVACSSQQPSGEVVANSTEPELVAIPAEPTVSVLQPTEPALAPTVAIDDELTEYLASEFSLGEWDVEETSKVWEWLKSNRWDTDFRFRTVNLTSIKSYNFRDGILPVDRPEFSLATEAPAYMNPNEPVVSLVIDGEARAYPLAILMWHEIVNDTVGDLPIVVTYCPLCNTAIIFESTVDGQALSFGTTGSLRNGDLVMWDRETQSWWQQITGAAIVGEYARIAASLKRIPTTIVSWDTFVANYPDGKVLNRLFDDDNKPVRSYDTPPYTAYDNSDRRPFAIEGEVDRRLVVTSRVLSLNRDTDTVAYPFDFLAENPVINDIVDGQPIVAVFDDGTISSFRNYDAEQPEVGSASAFSRLVRGRVLTFESHADGFTDSETGSVWTLSGKAIEGELTGEQLVTVIHGNDFWFAVALFWPDTEIRDSLDKLTANS